MLILHLSDIHLGNKNRFANEDPDVIARGFQRALSEAKTELAIPPSSKIEVVIVTGDLVETGMKSQFAAAHIFFSTLAAELGLPSCRFVFCPGNHDISWPSCHVVRARHQNQEITGEQVESAISFEKLSNYRTFLAEFYKAPVTDQELAGLPHSIALGRGGWLRNFPELRLSVASLNTSERENDQLKGGHLSKEQAQSLMSAWREPQANGLLKIIGLHHNPVATTEDNTKWTMDWLKKREQANRAPIPMPQTEFEHYSADLAGFSGRELLARVARDTCAHVVLHGHHHDQGVPVIWPWAKDGGAPVLSVGSFGLDEDQLPGSAPLSCQLLHFVLPPEPDAPRLVATPLIYDARYRIEGDVVRGAFRSEMRANSRYEGQIRLPDGWPACATSPKKNRPSAGSTANRDTTGSNVDPWKNLNERILTISHPVARIRDGMRESWEMLCQGSIPSEFEPSLNLDRLKLMDKLLVEVISLLGCESMVFRKNWTLVARGGFGLGYVSLGSDLDVTLFTGEDEEAGSAAFFDAFARMLADACVGLRGIRAAPLISTLQQCGTTWRGALAGGEDRDLSALVSFQATRCVYGSADLRTNLQDNWAGFVAGLDASQVARIVSSFRRRLEAKNDIYSTGLFDVKNGAGGILEYRMLCFLEKLMRIRGVSGRFSDDKLSHSHEYLLWLRDLAYAVTGTHVLSNHDLTGVCDLLKSTRHSKMKPEKLTSEISAHRGRIRAVLSATLEDLEKPGA